MPSIADEKGFEIMEIEADKDHIHLLARYSPKYSALQLVRLLKQISTFRLWRTNGNYQFLKRHFWKEQTFWSDGYFYRSVGSTTAEAVQYYVQHSQRKRWTQYDDYETRAQEKAQARLTDF